MEIKRYKILLELHSGSGLVHISGMFRYLVALPFGWGFPKVVGDSPEKSKLEVLEEMQIIYYMLYYMI